MPRLKPHIQRQRRERILEAAERCFARTGFHRTTMQDICKEAGISAGALYIYFDSKESLIEGITEANRTEFQNRFEAVADAPDLMAALSDLCNQYFVDEPAHKRLMCIEIGLEATRSDRVGEIYRSVDQLVFQSFQVLFQRLLDADRIAPRLEIPALAHVCMTMGDGLFWRRATDPAFDPQVVLPAVLGVIEGLLNPIPPAEADRTKARRPKETTR
jgi:AcrR family transcriptional regulator